MTRSFVAPLLGAALLVSTVVAVGAAPRRQATGVLTGVVTDSSLVIQQDGYFSQTLSQLPISVGQTITRNVSLQPQGRGILTGIVRDSSNQHPVGGARVMIQGTALTGSTSTDGKYTITGIPSGTVTLVVQRSGYIAEAFGGLRITDGQTTTRDVVLRPANPSAFRVIPIGPAAPIATGAP